MNLKKIVIHELVKQALVTGASLNCSNQCLNSAEERPQQLNSKLTEAFDIGRSKIDYAVFHDEKAFPKSLRSYLASGQTEQDFLDFSIDVLSKLRDQITNIAPARGGYLVFSEYMSQQMEFICIFLVRDTKGQIFTKVKQYLDIGEITYADTNKLAMACRINTGNFISKKQKPLLIINKKNKEVSDYFVNWLGASDKEDSELYTKELYNLISQIEPPERPDSSTGERLTLDETRKKVFEVVKTNLKGNVNLNTLSLLIYDDEDKISSFVKENNIEIPTEFRTYQKGMKKFVQIRVSNRDFLLQFSRGDLSKVSFSEDKESVIIRSKALVDELISQISALDS